MWTHFLKGDDGKIKHPRDDDWPSVIISLSSTERVIYSADGERLLLQIRTRSLRNDAWSKWRSVHWTHSHAEMRKLVEASHPFPCDNENLDLICLKTDDGDYVEHSH